MGTYRVGKDIWSAGKGASLDTYNWSLANDWRFALNEAAMIVPRCIGAFAVDIESMWNIVKYKANQCTLFIDPEYVCTVKSVEKLKNTKLEVKQYHELRQGIHYKTIFGVVKPAIQSLYSFGARRIHFIGFDSMEGYHKGTMDGWM